MAYTPYNKDKPDPAVDNGTTACSNIKNNSQAIVDAVLNGTFLGWNFAQSGGSVAEPTQMTYTNGALILRQTLTWDGTHHSPTTIVTDVSSNSGGAWDTVGTATITYTTGGEVSTATGFGGIGIKLWSLFGKITNAISSLNTHTSATGTSVHGLKDMATQTSTAITVTGGVLDGVTIGATTPKAGTFTIERETFTNLGTLTTGTTTTVTASVAGWQELTLPNSAGTCTIKIEGTAPSNLSGGMILNIIAQGTVPTMAWDANIKWPGGTAPTIVASKSNVITFLNRNGSTSFFGSLMGSYA